jgi:hypothetical protein
MMAKKIDDHVDFCVYANERTAGRDKALWKILLRFYCAGGLIDVWSDGTVFAVILRVKSAETGVNYFHCARAL